MRASSQSKPALAAAATGILVGAAMVATRSVASLVTPGALALLRYAIASFLLLPLFLLRRSRRVPGIDILKIGGLGVLQFAAVVGLLNVSLQRIPAARAALLFALCPALTLILESVVQRKRPRLAASVGMVLSLAGIAVVFGWDAIAGGEPMTWIGDGTAALSALVAALCTLCYRPLLARHGAITIGIYALPASAAALVVIAACEGFFASLPRLSGSAWLAIAFIGASSAVGFLLWLWALTHASPARVTAFLTLNPIAAAGFGAILLGESVRWSFAIGAVCVGVGIWLAYRSPLRRA